MLGSPMKTQLTDNEIQKFKEVLLSMRNETISLEKNLENEALEYINQAETEHTVDADLATETMTRDLDLKIAGVERLKLAKINGAIQRIENKTFGQCLECDEPIALSRLEVIPFTTHCLDCEELLEKDGQSLKKNHETDVNFKKPLVKQFK